MMINWVTLKCFFSIFPLTYSFFKHFDYYFFLMSTQYYFNVIDFLQTQFFFKLGSLTLKHIFSSVNGYNIRKFSP